MKKLIDSVGSGKSFSEAAPKRRGRPMKTKRPKAVKEERFPDIEDVSTTIFRADMNNLIRKCKTSRKPIVLSSHGHSEIALITLEDLEILQGINQGQKDMMEGKGKTMAQMDADIRKRMGWK